MFSLAAASLGIVGAPRTDVAAKKLLSWATAAGVRTALPCVYSSGAQSKQYARGHLRRARERGGRHGA